MAWRWLAARRRDREIDDELAAHLEMATRDGIDRGMSPEDARAAATRALGNVPLIKQATREVWPWTRVEHAIQDVRFGARILWQSPGLSATAVLLIALVVGANTTIYSIVHGMLVSPARGVTADRLVAVKHVEPGVPIADPFVSFPNYTDYTRFATTVTDVVGWTGERFSLGTESGTYAVFGSLVTTNYFDTLGVMVTHGRTLRASDEEARDGTVAVISDGVWRERFGQDPGVIGRAISINGVAATIVGVAAPGFRGALLTPGEDVWVPIRAYYDAIGSAGVLTNRSQPLVAMIAQRKPSVSVAAVRAEFEAVAAQLRASYPESFTAYSERGVVPMRNPRVTAAPYSAAALLPVGDMAPTFLVLFSIVTALTLLVVSANVANLMLGRAVERQRDTAVRQSLGASRGRILRMLIAEGAVVSIVAWGAASAVAWWTSRLLLQVVEPRAGLLVHVRPDWTLGAYAMVLAAAATVAFTFAPGWRVWRLPVLPLLKSGESSVARGRSRLSNALVVLQLVLSVVLLTAAGLAYRSLSMLDAGRVGFDAEPMLLVTVRVGRQEAFVTSTPSPADRRAELATLERVRERLAQERHVVAVSYARRVPGPFALGTTPVRILGAETTTPVFVRTVGPDYLRALGLATVAGRELTSVDLEGSTRTGVINRQLAHTLFAGRSPVGQTLLIDERGTPIEIVGVAPDALFDGPVHDPQPRYVFVAQQQVTDGRLMDMTFFIRHTTTPEALAPTVGRAIAEVDPAIPIVSISTMAARLSQVTELQAQVTTLVVVFAVVALVVAGLGQYAVAMFNMRRRTRELGVRIALGASPGRIRRAVLREALGVTLPGLAIGFALSSAVAIAFRTALFGVTPLDPPAYGWRVSSGRGGVDSGDLRSGPPCRPRQRRRCSSQRVNRPPTVAARQRIVMAILNPTVGERRSAPYSPNPRCRTSADVANPGPGLGRPALLPPDGPIMAPAAAESSRRGRVEDVRTPDRTHLRRIDGQEPSLNLLGADSYGSAGAPLAAAKSGGARAGSDPLTFNRRRPVRHDVDPLLDVLFDAFDAHLDQEALAVRGDRKGSLPRPSARRRE
jgi:predicted permease